MPTLRAFHIAFITLSALVCVGFAGWAARQWVASRRASLGLLGIAAFCLGGALSVYGAWFARKIPKEKT